MATHLKGVVAIWLETSLMKRLQLLSSQGEVKLKENRGACNPSVCTHTGTLLFWSKEWLRKSML